MATYLTQDHFTNRLKIGTADYGLWNRDDITFGSETKAVFDPDDGPGVVGGAQTVEPFTMSRLWKLDRESTQFGQITALRGRTEAEVAVHEKDPSTGQPRSSTPLMTLKGFVSETVLPASQRNGSDEVLTQLTFTPQA